MCDLSCGAFLNIQIVNKGGGKRHAYFRNAQYSQLPIVQRCVLKFHDVRLRVSVLLWVSDGPGCGGLGHLASRAFRDLMQVDRAR